MSSSPDTPKDDLDLESLDADSLFSALTAVEKAIPQLLLQVKPILAQLSAPSQQSAGTDEETRGTEARQGVERYITLLDKIQFVLRQAVYYLRETRASPQTLRPPPAHSIPTPFASTMPSLPAESSAVGEGKQGRVELGLYASRIEVKALRDMEKALQALKEDITSAPAGSQEVEWSEKTEEAV